MNNTAWAWFWIIVGNIIFFIAIFSAYIWFLPLGLALELIGCYLYVQDKRQKKREQLAKKTHD